MREFIRRSVEVCRSEMNDVVVPSKKHDALRNFAKEREKEQKEMGLKNDKEMGLKSDIAMLMCLTKYDKPEDIKAECPDLSDSIIAGNLVTLCNKINSHIKTLIKDYDNACYELEDLDRGRLAQARERLIQTYDKALEKSRLLAKIATNDALEANKAMLGEEQRIVGQIEAIHRLKTDKKMMNKSRRGNLRKLYKLCGDAHKTQKDINGYLLSWDGMKGYRKKNTINYVAEKMLGEASLPSPMRGGKLIDQLQNVSEQIRSCLEICRDGGGSGNRGDNDGDGSGNRRDNDGDGSGNRRDNDGDGSGNRRDNDAKHKAITKLYELLEKYLDNVTDEAYIWCLRHANQRHGEVNKELNQYIQSCEEVEKLEKEREEKDKRFQKCEDALSRVREYAERARHNYSIMRAATIQDNSQLQDVLVDKVLPDTVQYEYEKLQERKLQDQGIGSSNPTNSHETSTSNRHPGKGIAQGIGSSNPTEVARRFTELLDDYAREVDASRMTYVTRQFAGILQDIAEKNKLSGLAEVANQLAGLGVEDKAQEIGLEKPANSQGTSESNQRTGKAVAQETGSGNQTERSTVPTKRRRNVQIAS